MTRSLPEKTFEHWCSMHLTYRYRAKLRMWWPANGEDISIESSRVLLGKRFWLELKTTEWDVKQGKHLVQVDLDQLYRYQSSTIPDYYVFAVPVWSGSLDGKTPNAWLGNLHWSSLGHQSHSAHKWFAEWTWVVSGARLRHVLRTDISKYHKGSRKTAIKTIASTQGNGLQLAKGVSALREILWHSFWQRMETCGGEDMPAQFILPHGSVASPQPPSQLTSHAGAGRHRPASTSRQALVSALTQLSDDVAVPVDAAEVFSPVSLGREYVNTPHGKTLELEDFQWDSETSRGLMSLTPQALRL